MRHLASLFAIALAVSAQARTFTLMHVNVIDVASGRVERDVNVTVSGNRITDVSQRPAPKDAEQIDGEGKFLIPGLWDMHVHWYDKQYLPLFIANGVTGIRIMWGSPLHHQWSDEFGKGTLIGPRQIIGSSIIDGPKPVWPSSTAVKDAAQARAAVAREKAAGAEFIKIYSLLPRDAVPAIFDEAKRRRLPVVGHVPNSIRASEISDLGMKSIEHMTGILLEASSHEESIRAELNAPDQPGGGAAVMRRRARELLDTYDPAKAGALFKRLAKNGTWICPTLTVLRSTAFLNDPEITSDARLRYMPPSMRAMWDPKTDFRFKDFTPQDYQNRRDTYAQQKRQVAEMRKAGIRFLAGTDVLNPYCFPGFSLHDELALLVEAGLSPLEALQAATSNVAAFTGNKDYGAVSGGKIADLVLLEANPLDDIHNTTKIVAVVSNGRYFARAALDQMLHALESAPTARSRGGSGRTSAPAPRRTASRRLPAGGAAYPAR